MTDKPKEVQPVATDPNPKVFLNHLSVLSPSREALDAIRLKREHEEADRARLEEGERAFTARCYRRLARIEKWAQNRSRKELVEHLSLAALLLIEKNKSARHVDRMRSHMEGVVKASTLRAQVNKSLARDFLCEIMKSKEDRRKGGVIRAEKSPKTKAMAAIKVEFNRWQDGDVQYINNPDFAKAMMRIYGAVIDNEGSIKNKCTKWRKERKKSSS